MASGRFWPVGLRKSEKNAIKMTMCSVFSDRGKEGGRQADTFLQEHYVTSGNEKVIIGASELVVVVMGLVLSEQRAGKRVRKKDLEYWQN